MDDKNFCEPVCYALRFQILPGGRALPLARKLAAFCRQHRIRSVHLFMNAEEWNRGHMTEAEIRRHLNLFMRIVPLLRKSGLSVSLNPWCTTLHATRGRLLRPGQGFECMASPAGKRAMAVASFACPRWRRYIVSLYGRMAAIGFDVIWIEDDFRYHNHDGLDWGGDFSEAMLARFAKKIGRKASRAEVVRNVLRPGRPHPWRKLWLELWRECQEQVASAIRDAVMSADPHARLGIMSSCVDVHSAEGRNWQGLFGALAINGRTAHRAHFASYGESPADPSLVRSYLALDVQKRLRPAWVESYPEIENFPFGRFQKSDAMTFAQMALAKIMGSEGLLLDLHPMTGNDVTEELGIGEMLDKSYPALAWLGRQFPRELESRGAGVPFKADAAETMHLPAGATYDRLVSSTYVPGYVLGQAGIASQMAASPNVNVIWGLKAWAFSDDEIRYFLGRGLWLDAEATEILTQRGFGKCLGVRIKSWQERQRSLYAIERVTHPASGIRAGFNAGCNAWSRILVMEPVANTERWTDIVDCMGKTMGAGLTVFQNALGGRIAVSAFPLHREVWAWNMNFQRQTLIQRLIRYLAGRHPPVMISGAPHALTMELQSASERKVVVINLWPDPAEITVAIPGAKRVGNCMAIFPLNNPAPARYEMKHARGLLEVKPLVSLPYFGMAVLAIKE